MSLAYVMNRFMQANSILTIICIYVFLKRCLTQTNDLRQLRTFNKHELTSHDSHLAWKWLSICQATSPLMNCVFFHLSYFQYVSITITPGPFLEQSKGNNFLHPYHGVRNVRGVILDRKEFLSSEILIMPTFLYYLLLVVEPCQWLIEAKILT